MYGCILFTGKTGQCSDIARDEREAEPGGACWGMLSAHSEVSKLWEATKTGLGGVGRVYLKRPRQGLKGSIGRSWPGGKVEGYSHFCLQDHGLVRSSCSLLSVRGWLVNFSAGS